MERRWQFSLAYIFLELFWVAVTLALAREAFWLHFRYRSFYDGWSEPGKAPIFAALVIAAVICGSTAIGGIFGRMKIGALVAVSGFVAVLALHAIFWVFSPAIH